MITVAATPTLFIANRAFLIPLDSRIGTSDIVSTPPTTTTSFWPDSIWEIPNKKKKRICDIQLHIVTTITLSELTSSHGHVRGYASQGNSVAGVLSKTRLQGRPEEEGGGVG